MARHIANRSPISGHNGGGFWERNIADFDAKHGRHHFRNVNPLYAIPRLLVDAISEAAPTWFAHGELVFERDLAHLLDRHYASAILHGKTVSTPILVRPPASIVSEDDLNALGWDRFTTLARSRLGAEEGCGLVDDVDHRMIAYAGWLLTNPRFLAERNRLQSRWGVVVEQLGNLPDFPVQDVETSVSNRQPTSDTSTRVARGRRRKRAGSEKGDDGVPRGGKNVTGEFVGDFNEFYSRWELQRLATWDLPEPIGANLSGYQIPNNLPGSVNRFVLDVPSTLRLCADFPLHRILQNVQRGHHPEHLRDWFAVQDQQHEGGLGHGRFADVFRIAYYRDTVLASRYRDRFAGNILKLDEAFAAFLNTSVDSVKKLRIWIAKLRSDAPVRE